MSHCQRCGTKFTLIDVLKGFNPASVKCSGCPARIHSSYATLTSSVSLAILMASGFWFLPIAKGPYAGEAKFLFLAVVAYLFECLYYYLLTRGYIKSNLALTDRNNYRE